MAPLSIYEIIATPPEGATGDNLLRILAALDVSSRTSDVIVADVECNGDRSWIQPSPFRTSVQRLFEYAARVGQFDWGTFFFFRETTQTDIARSSFQSLFLQADITVRAVDDTYFYVYSPNLEDAERVTAIFPAEFQEKSKDAVGHPF